MIMGYINKQNVEQLIDAYYDDEVVRFNSDNARQLEELGYSELPENRADAMEVILSMGKQDDILYNWLVLKRDLTMK